MNILLVIRMKRERKELIKRLDDDRALGTKMVFDILRLLEKEQSENTITIEKLALPLNQKRERVKKIIRYMRGMGLVEEQEEGVKITKFGSCLLKTNN